MFYFLPYRMFRFHGEKKSIIISASSIEREWCPVAQRLANLIGAKRKKKLDQTDIFLETGIFC